MGTLLSRARVRRRILILGIVVLVAAAAIPLLDHDLVWLVISTRRMPVDDVHGGHRVIGYTSVKRWAPEIRHGRTLLHFADTGFKRLDGDWIDGKRVRCTVWTFDGTIRHQANGLDEKVFPPWWWGETNQGSR